MSAKFDEEANNGLVAIVFTSLFKYSDDSFIHKHLFPVDISIYMSFPDYWIPYKSGC